MVEHGGVVARAHPSHLAGRRIDFQQVGYGSAAATLLFLVIALATSVYIALTRSRLEDPA